jgi:RNA polymerase sigma factor (sigma-70 family)
MTDEISPLAMPLPDASKGVALQPKPLTREGYVRRDEVEDCIAAALALDPAAFRTRIRQADEKRPDYFPPEALVYFIRQAFRLGQKQTVDLVMRELYERCKQFFRKNIREFFEKDREDVTQDIMEKIAKDIFDPGDEADFAEHSFWLYLQNKTRDMCDKHRRKLKRLSLTLDTGWEKSGEEKNATPLDGLGDERRLPDEALLFKEDWAEKTRRIEQALAQLPPKLRHVYILSRGLDAKNESKHENKMTLSRFFGVSEKTIRTWLKEADQILASFLEG